MVKFQLNKALLLALITAFFTMQWASAHIHLAEHHDHDGSHHQHSIEAHSHDPIGHHADIIDSAHQAGDNNVVELDPEYRTTIEQKLKYQPVALVSSAFQSSSISQSSTVELPEIINTKLSFLERSNVRLRAPPQYS